MAGRRVDRAGSLVESDVLAEYADGFTIDKRVTEYGALKPRSGKAREDRGGIPAECFRDTG